MIIHAANVPPSKTSWMKSRMKLPKVIPPSVSFPKNVSNLFFGILVVEDASEDCEGASVAGGSFEGGVVCDGDNWVSAGCRSGNASSSATVSPLPSSKSTFSVNPISPLFCGNGPACGLAPSSSNVLDIDDSAFDAIFFK